MAHYKMVARLVMDSGIPDDAVVNTWHCDALVLPDGWETFRDDLLAFYQTVDALLSANVAATGHTLTTYAMADPEPRAPINTVSLGTLTTGATAMPPELAICLSFQGQRISGTSQARRRGRVYIGPLKNSNVSSTDMNLDTTVTDALRDAGQALVNASNASADYTWCVYSAADDALVPVHNGWVDNAFDIQRRRGLTASQRDVFSL